MQKFKGFAIVNRQNKFGGLVYDCWSTPLVLVIKDMVELSAPFFCEKRKIHFFFFSFIFFPLKCITWEKFFNSHVIKGSYIEEIFSFYSYLIDWKKIWHLACLLYKMQELFLRKKRKEKKNLYSQWPATFYYHRQP